MKILNIPYNNHKTQKCKFFEQEGQCKFGKNCSFAHGLDELRNPYEPLPIAPPTAAPINPFPGNFFPPGPPMQ